MRFSIYFLCALAMSVTAIAPADDAVTGTLKEMGKTFFSEVERRVIRDYYQEKFGDIEHAPDSSVDDSEHARKKKHKKHKAKGKPHGLPPGVAKKVARGGELPPGIAKKHLPQALESQLPPPAPGYERAIVDDAVVLIDTLTERVVDVIRGRGAGS